MKTLDEHNKFRLAEYEAMEKALLPHNNGIACPKCGAELWDSNPSILLTSNPPQKNIDCHACGYVGYRLA